MRLSFCFWEATLLFQMLHESKSIRVGNAEPVMEAAQLRGGYKYGSYKGATTRNSDYFRMAQERSTL
jgi:hypothetical protein